MNQSIAILISDLEYINIAKLNELAQFPPCGCAIATVCHQ